ncbi:MAG: 3-keto-disaccharide hydrolase [Flavobacteriaceae bacterium]
MKIKSFIVVLGLCLGLGLSAQEKFKKKDLFFNGKNFENWAEPENNIWWSITEEGHLVAKSDPDKKGSTLWSQEAFEDFAIRLEFKMGEGTVDSGIFMRGENPQNPQIQIGISGSLKRDMTGSPYVPKQGYPVDALKDHPNVLKDGAWNTLEAKAVGNNYQVWLNNVKVLDYQLENANLKGPTGLQLHPGRDMDIAFKNIYLKRL